MKIILSIDGGGIRGIIPATILSYLEQKIQEIVNDNRIKIGNLIDFVAGTSTGSVIGSLMLIPDDNNFYPKYKMTEIIDFYLSLGDKVFRHNLLHDIKNVWGLFGPRFKNSNIYTKQDCSECWARFYCSGGCVANSHQFNNDINIPYKIGCALEKKRVECALWIASQA